MKIPRRRHGFPVAAETSYYKLDGSKRHTFSSSDSGGQNPWGRGVGSEVLSGLLRACGWPLPDATGHPPSLTWGPSSCAVAPACSSVSPTFSDLPAPLLRTCRYVRCIWINQDHLPISRSLIISAKSSWLCDVSESHFPRIKVWACLRVAIIFCLPGGDLLIFTYRPHGHSCKAQKCETPNGFSPGEATYPYNLAVEHPWGHSGFVSPAPCSILEA